MSDLRESVQSFTPYGSPVVSVINNRGKVLIYMKNVSLAVGHFSKDLYISSTRKQRHTSIYISNLEARLLYAYVCTRLYD